MIGILNSINALKQFDRVSKSLHLNVKRSLLHALLLLLVTLSVSFNVIVLFNYFFIVDELKLKNFEVLAYISVLPHTFIDN